MVAGSSRLAAGLAALVMSACGSSADPGEPQPEQFRVIGYVTDRGATKLDDDTMDASSLLGVIRGTVDRAAAEP